MYITVITTKMEDYAKFLHMNKRNKAVYMVNSRHVLGEDDIEEIFPELYKKLKSKFGK